MTWFLSIVLLGLGVILPVSLVRWNLGRALRKSLTLSDYHIFNNKSVSAAATLKAGETLGIPIKCDVAIGQREIHIIPIRYNPLLFMTDFPFTFSKKSNKKLKIQRSESNDVVFTGRQRKSSVFGSEIELTILMDDSDEKKELLKMLKSWK